ncbi:P-loop containing nucleoside triphosphate hydrolase protein, partial [Rhizoctonia solani]
RCPAPTKLYTGRKDENGQIIACITGNNRERRVCVVYGLGGIGKTQLVLNAIERTWDEWDCIIYVDASSAEAIEEALEEFAEAKAIGQSYNGVISLLESCGERWLIVFDNADDPSTNIRKYVPTRGRGCSVIITTRLPDLTRLAGGPNSLCHLSSTNQTDGMALLVKIVSLGNQRLPDDEMNAAGGLCLALAIVHAGAYIVRSPSMTITKYRDLFLSQRRRMLEEYSDLPIPAKLDDYGDIVYTTWRMCYDQLKPESRALLWLIAYLHYDGISEDIFRLAAQNMHNPDKYSLPLINLEFQALDRVKLHLFTYLDSNGDWDTVAFIRIMADLTSYSLIDFDKTNLTYRVHVLVHDWARTVIPQGSDLAIECTATLLSLSVGSEEDAVFLAFKRRLGLRVTSVLVHNPNIGTNHCDWLRHVYEETGQWSQKAQLDQQVLWAFQRELGDGNVKTWRIMNELAVSYAALGQWDVAERLQVQAVDAYKQLWGKTHPETLKATGALAGTYFHMGQLEEAERLQIQVLDGCKKLRGEEHPETSIAMSNLTNTYSSLNRCNEAEQLQVQVLYVRVRDLGEEHPRTLTAMNNLAATYSKLGQWNEAGELYLRCITIAERVLGDQHPRVELYRENLKKTLAQGYKESVSRFNFFYDFHELY